MSSQDRITIAQRQALLAGLPVFAFLTSQETEELAKLMHEMYYSAGELIVLEGNLVDSVYIVVEGQAEVSRKLVKKNRLTKKTKTVQVPVSILNPGEAIGLNDTGFFSDTGQRTATVMAISSMRVLVLSLNDLHQFLHAHPSLKSEMRAVVGQLLRIKLIKQSLPFSKLSHERLQWLAHQVEEEFVPEGTIIFKEGYVGNKCYLIQSGQVEITSELDGETRHHIAILKSPTLFGEATLITGSPRNATAIAQTDCHLLVLRHEYLTELLETENNVSQMLMTLMINRSKPLRNPRVTTHHRLTADKQHIVILKNPDNGTYFKLSMEGLFIWEQLNGKQTMQEITLVLVDKFNIFAPDLVAALISKLSKNEFVINVKSDKEKLPNWQRGLNIRMTIGNADHWLTSIYQKGLYLLFTLPGKIILLLVAVVGAIAFISAIPDVIHIFKYYSHSWLLFLLLIPFTLLSTGLHELGHALTTKSFGHEVHHMGVGWNWYYPVAFTDTSDMWLSTRWSRIAVNLAGIGTDILVAGVASLLFFIVSQPYIQGFLWLFAVYTYLNAFRMLSPLQDLDGYYVMMDLLDRPHLRQSCSIWLVRIFPKCIRHPSLLRQFIPEMTYWLVCIIFLIVLTLVTYLIQSFVFKILGFQPSSIWSTLIIPIIIVFFTGVGIYQDVRNYTEE